jgi:hypothetical protein
MLNFERFKAIIDTIAHLIENKRITSILTSLDNNKNEKLITLCPPVNKCAQTA